MSEEYPVWDDVCKQIKKAESNAYARMNFETGQKIMKLLADSVNGGNTKELSIGMLEQLFREHRYLQANVIDAMVNVLVQAGRLHRENRARWADARNDYALENAAKVAEAVKERWPW